MEQSNAFVFADGELISFNGEVLTRIKNPLEDLDGVAVVAEDFVSLISKFPDDEVDVSVVGSEVRLKGARRNAGLKLQAEVLLPYGGVPKAKRWTPVADQFVAVLVQASRVCGKDQTQPRTTEVHVTPEAVEASDNFRIFRYALKTGLKKDSTLIPASTIDRIGSLSGASKVSETSGWLHIRTKTGHVVSLRGNASDYPDLTPHLTLKKSKLVTLPSNLGDILGRADVMHETAQDAVVSITIKDGKLSLKAEKDSGWYRESKKITYDGPALTFQVHPKFLQDVVSKTRKVRIGGNRMKIKSGSAVFVVALEIPND